MVATPEKATAQIQHRYNRLAPVYDRMEGVVEKMVFKEWRRLLWSKVEGPTILEIGVGTGKNLPYYPPGVRVTAIDFSEQMLARAREKARKQGFAVRLMQMDVQNLEFEDESFDTVATSFVFCSVPAPVAGLREVARVCRRGGKVIMLEHVLSSNRLIALWMNLVNPLLVRVTGANMNRRTVNNVEAAGLTIEKVTNLRFDIFKLIEARKV